MKEKLYKKNFCNGVNREKIGMWLLFLLFITVVTTSVLFQIFGCKGIKGNFIFNCFLSGLSGAFLSAFFVFFGFNKTNDTKKIENQLKLREMFAEERRWEVHRTLEKDDVLYWYKLSGENEKDIAWESSKAFTHYFLLALDDYMGLFEIAYMMLEKGQLERRNFAVSYLYRLENLTKCEVAMQKVNETEVFYWQDLRRLIKMFSL